MKDKINKLSTLTERFESNYAQYMSNSYDESNTRSDFIDRFFELLDWDMRNEQGFSEIYRDVVREDKVSIDGKTKAPDYSFRIGGTVKFYVEAKKPSINIKDNPEPAYQVRRYAWTKKLALSILTDFEEFAVYDTRIKPNQNDAASAARIFYCTFREYEKHFDFIYNTFSKNAILLGSFDKYIEENKNKKGTTPIDEDLLRFVEDWRVELAKNIALRNPDISVYNLNTVVQKIIDRILFLRIAESKGIEDADLLKTVSCCENVYRRLNQLFINVNIKYNSSFFKQESWIEQVKIDDRILSNIIVNLYYPDCPYEFSVLPVEILGLVYEKFLGKTIYFRGVKGGHTAIVEEKPEVRKAGGVFYTPQYIVQFIVKNTVGKLIAGKTPDEIEKIKIVDPACGSGSMLAGAYQFFLDYHIDYYTAEKNLKSALKKGKIYRVRENTYKLTIIEKQRILRNNIYGVDIDSSAVEVTKLSLYLKLLEGEGQEAEGQLFGFSDFTLLPDLDENIKSGNSLVGTDFYTATLGIDNDELRKINCFDWDKEFPLVFKNGGFDAVIGNPPYYNMQSLGAGDEQAVYIQSKYSKIWQDKSDILFYFIYKAMQLSKSEIGYIVSNAFLFSDKAQKLRNSILDDGRLSKIVNFEQYQIFADASITSGVFIFNGTHTDNKIQAAVFKEKASSAGSVAEFMNNKKNYFPVTLSKNDVFALVDKKVANLNRKIDGKHPLLQDICLIGKGMETAANDVFLFKEYPSQFPPKFIKKRLVGENISPYYLENNPEYLLYFEDIDDIKNLTEVIQEHLKVNKKDLKERATVKNEGRVWWRYSRPMHKEYYHLPKIWCSYRSKNNAFVLDESDQYIGLTNTTVIFGTNTTYSLKYLLTILNSKLFKWRYNSLAKQTGSGVFEYVPNAVGRFPIPALDLSKPSDKTAHDKLVALVDKMLDLKRREHDEPNPQAKTVLQRQIGAVDGQIDTAVYDLYKLTEEEINMVEGESNDCK
ncbi:MAG: Eco57I restriction-modification methylase domain-containing protein [Termitinemataceae bacterium]|nr:MAG: Eco57I restriction-modification methylase domain-containing protein [Termitinemataceae bacterium]